MKHSMHFPILQDLGLNEAESLVFEVLLEEGPQIGSTIAQKADLARGNVYNALATLKDKGFVHEQGKTKITEYAASDPERLRSLIEQKKASVEALQGQFEAIAPQLKGFYRMFTKQPTIRLFEGIEGLKSIYREILTAKNGIYSIVSADAIDPDLYRWMLKVYKKKRVESGIPVKGIVQSGDLAGDLLARAASELRTIQTIDPEKYQLSGEVNVFNESVAIIAHRSDQLFGMIIESSSIAQTIKSIIEVLYDSLSSSHAAKEVSDALGKGSNTTMR